MKSLTEHQLSIEFMDVTGAVAPFLAQRKPQRAVDEFGSWREG